MIWRQLVTPAVRDLAWACYSQPLVHSKRLESVDTAPRNCTLQLTDSRREFLLQLDRHPAALLAELQERGSTRLGIYFEKLWHYLLAADPDIDLVAHNLPVRENGKTLGEFDIIYFCHQRQQHVHLELAVKFYLEVAAEPHWLGPGCKDSLDRKIEHLLHRQIRLSQTAAGAAVLETLGVEAPVGEIELKGYLFGHSERPPLPDAYNHGNELSRWLDWQSFLAQQATTRDGLDWVILPRLQWLAPCNLGIPGGELLDRASEQSLHTHFGQHRQPLLLAGCDSSGQEQRRCFVTPQHWPWS